MPEETCRSPVRAPRVRRCDGEIPRPVENRVGWRTRSTFIKVSLIWRSVVSQTPHDFGRRLLREKLCLFSSEALCEKTNAGIPRLLPYLVGRSKLGCWVHQKLGSSTWQVHGKYSHELTKFWLNSNRTGNRPINLRSRRSTPPN